MPTSARTLDISLLPPAARREVQDFYQFILARSQVKRRRSSKSTTNFSFSDLCGKLSWRGDAVAAQRNIRDEW